MKAGTKKILLWVVGGYVLLAYVLPIVGLRLLPKKDKGYDPDNPFPDWSM